MKRWILLTIVSINFSLAFAEDPPQGSPGAAFIKALDANADGNVSKDEFTQPQLQQIVKQFDYMDKNHDNQINVGEAESFAQEMHQHMQQMQSQGSEHPSSD